MRNIALLSLFFLVLSGSPTAPALAQEREPRIKRLFRPAADAPHFVAGEVLARFPASLPEQAIEAIVQAHDSRTLGVGARSGYRRLAVPPGLSEADLVAQLRRDARVEHAQLNHIAYAFACPNPPANDPEYCLQWHYYSGQGHINVKPAWDTFTGSNAVTGYNGSGVTVAVVDTGLAYKDFPPIPQAPEWAGQQWKVALPAGVDLDLVNPDSEPNDDHSHGTHVSNTIAQHTNNSLLAAGVANGAKILPVKVLDGSGSGTELAVAEGILLAAEYAQVINMSLGWPQGTTVSELQVVWDAITSAYTKGVTIVAAAGNDGAGSCSYPAGFPEVICVGAVKYDGQLTWYSNHGTGLELVAPGGAYCASADDLLCFLIGYPYYFNDQNNDGWPDGVLQETFGFDLGCMCYLFDDWFFEGTSMASPHVAAVAALVIGKAQSLGIAATPEYVRNILKSTAKDKGAAGYDSTYGWGLVDAAAAVSAVGGSSSTPTPTPTATPVPTATPTPTPALTCTAPVITSHTDTNPSGGGSVSFAWDAVIGATQYTVQRQKTDGSWSTRQTSSALSFKGGDAANDPLWRVFVSAGTCAPLPGPETVFDP